MTAKRRRRPAKRRFPIALTLFTALALALLVGLGVWQIQRLHWKEALLARIAALQTAPAEPIAIVLRRIPEGADVDYTRVQLDCPAVQSTRTVKLYSIREGGAGWRIITACPLPQGAVYSSVLVDRGFISDQAIGTLRPGPAIAEPVVGVLRKGDKATFVTPANDPARNLWYSRDPAGMAAMLHARKPAPVFLMLERPAPGPGGPTPAALPTNIPNRHFEYAITWFGLAAALLVVYLASLFRRRT